MVVKGGAGCAGVVLALAASAAGAALLFAGVLLLSGAAQAAVNIKPRSAIQCRFLRAVFIMQ